ncbi:hypothetical protein AMELA_G00176810, partial [Ameiurus melas]
PDDTTQHEEIKNEVTENYPELTRKVPEHSRTDDENDRVIGEEPTLFPDNTKPLKEIRREVADANPKLCQKAPQQSNTDEHNVIRQDVTPLPKDTKQNIEKEMVNEVTYELKPEEHQQDGWRQKDGVG